MATVRHFGLFPKGCVATYDQLVAEGYSTENLDLFYVVLPSEETALKITWRVKTWVGTITSPQRSPVSYQVNWYDTATSEKSIVCEANRNLYSGSSLDPNDPLNTENTSISLGRYLSAGFPLFYKKNDAYYINATLFDWDIGTNFASCSVNDDLEFVWQWDLKDNLGNTFFNGEATIRPQTWWGYDPEDGGGPIYNTSTGAQIRSNV